MDAVVQESNFEYGIEISLGGASVALKSTISGITATLVLSGGRKI